MQPETEITAHAWCDGSGLGGWGAVIVTDSEFVHILGKSSGKKHTSRIEIQAIIGALNHLPPGNVMIYTDQSNIMRLFGKHGAESTVPSGVKDRDLLNELKEAMMRHESVQFKKVVSGADIFHNVADDLARRGAKI